MKKTSILLTAIALLGIFPLYSCAKNEVVNSKNVEVANEQTGTLQLRANGEDFVRQGFLSKDGWQIAFDHIYVNLAEVQAYQAEPAYDAHSGGEINAKETVNLVSMKTVDLAAGDENAEPILVAEIPAPTGKYNALSWKMTPATLEPAKGYPLVLIGQATQAGETINFTLKINQELAFTCGDFVGDTRKGILQPGGTADLEATFHFDHLFGDGESPPDDDINTGALGFQPLADIAENNQVVEDLTSLNTKLTPEDYQKLKEILPSLGHVGEGHCHESVINSGEHSH
jgi:hypothetical protein